MVSEFLRELAPSCVGHITGTLRNVCSSFSAPPQSSVSKMVTGTNSAKLSGSFLNFTMEDFTQQCAPCLDVSCPPSITALPSSSQSFWEKDTVSGCVVWERYPYSSVKERRTNLCRDVLAPLTALFCCHPRHAEQGGVGKPGTSLPQPSTASTAQSALRAEQQGGASPKGTGMEGRENWAREES